MAQVVNAPVRIGILGASSFAPTTLINPARENDEVVVAAVGARDMPSAEAFAAKYGIARAHGSYEALVDDPDLDAIYVLLPTSFHGRWTRAALAAGKHVLCEKPFTANAADYDVTVKLDQASTLTLGTGAGETAIGSSGADTLIAGAVGQTLTGGGGADTLVGYGQGGTSFKDTAADLSGDLLE